jgi:hypothetical protein
MINADAVLGHQSLKDEKVPTSSGQVCWRQVIDGALVQKAN